MSNLQVSRDKQLNGIFFRAALNDQMVYRSLRESSIKYLLLEEIDQADINKVKTAIDDGKKQIDSLSKYLDGFKNLDRSKIALTDTHISALSDALNKAQGELGGASFESGAVSDFFGEKLTLPQVAQAAVALHTKAADFGTGFSKAMDNIQNNLGPLVKDDADKEKPLRDLAGSLEGFPSEDKLQKGIEKAMKTALGGGFFGKIASFFKGGVQMGAEKRIMQSLPDIDPDAMAAEIAEALLDSTFDDLLEKPPESTTDPGELEDVATESQEAEQAAGGEAPAGAEGGTPEEDAAAAQSAAETAAAEADNKPFGTALMDVVAAFAEPYKDDEAVMDSIDRLRLDMRDAFKGRRDDMKGAFKNRFKDWFGELDDDAKAQVAPAAVEGIAGAFTDVVDDHLKFESIQQRFDDLLNEDCLLNSEHIEEETKSEFKYSEENMTAYRMNKLAGLE